MSGNGDEAKKLPRMGKIGVVAQTTHIGASAAISGKAAIWAEPA